MNSTTPDTRTAGQIAFEAFYPDSSSATWWNESDRRAYWEKAAQAVIDSLPRAGVTAYMVFQALSRNIAFDKDQDYPQKIADVLNSLLQLKPTEPEQEWEHDWTASLVNIPEGWEICGPGGVVPTVRLLDEHIQVMYAEKWAPKEETVTAGAAARILDQRDAALDHVKELEGFKIAYEDWMTHQSRVQTLLMNDKSLTSALAKNGLEAACDEIEALRAKLTASQAELANMTENRNSAVANFMDMTPPTQSPATAAAEAISSALFNSFQLNFTDTSGRMTSEKEIAKFVLPFVQSAYASTEQELRHARRLLQETHRICSEIEGDDFLSDISNHADTIKNFLSKNSNLPRE